MQIPASRPTPNDPNDPNDTDDRTVLLNKRAIRQAAPFSHPTPTRVPPPYPPGPGYPTASYPTPHPSAAPVATIDRNTGNGDDESDDAPKFALTSTQVVASMSAAVVAAFIGAQLGVAGTILGAAIASVVSVVGSAVIGHSLLLTRRRVTQTVQHVRAGADSPADAAETVLLTAVTQRVEIERSARSMSTGRSIAEPKPKGWWGRPGRLRWMLVGLAASAAVFAGAIGAVTVVEAVKGAPISGGDSGFSVLGGNNRTEPDDAPSSSNPTTVTEATSAPASASTAPSTSSSAPSPTSSAPPTTASSTQSSSQSSTQSSPPTTASSTPAPPAGTETAAASAVG